MQTESGPQESVQIVVVWQSRGRLVQSVEIPPAISRISSPVNRRTVSALRESFLSRLDFMDEPLFVLKDEGFRLL